MRLELTGRHVTITAAIQKVVERRLAHTVRILNDSLVSVQVVITRESLVYARGWKAITTRPSITSSRTT